NGADYTGFPSSGTNFSPNVQFDDVQNMLDWSPGPNSTFASASNIAAPLAGFVAETDPSNAIVKVEAVLQVFVPASVGSDIHVSAALGGQSGSSVTLHHNVLNQHIGLINAGPIYLDLTSTRTWQWSDFAGGDLNLLIDQTALRPTELVYYDAVGLRITS